MSILAYDLGASSGRAIVGDIDGNIIKVREIHRFSNDPVQIGDRLHWDILRIFHELKAGLLAAKFEGSSIESLAIDSWAVDFGFIDKKGELIGNPIHYRDTQNNGIMEEVFKQISPQQLYGRTGIQFLPFNSIFQLVAMNNRNASVLDHADQFLMIPDLLRYFLTGEKSNEFTNASTTQLFNPLLKKWDYQLIEQLGLSPSLFKNVGFPGETKGNIRTSISNELGISSSKVIMVAEHDTGSAVVAVPSYEKSFAYLSCGTWSLLGTELEVPLISNKTLEYNFTNEGGINQTSRFLKNIMGLWIVQELKREWDREGSNIGFAELVNMAKTAVPFRTLIDPDDEMFLGSGNMTNRINQFAKLTGQPQPDSFGAYVRCVLESLALKYRMVLELTEQLTSRNFSGLHVVGGGIQNQLLMQFTANAIGRPVWAGPAEGSAIGNLAVQWIANGIFCDVWEARKVIRESFPIHTFEPEDHSRWESAYDTFQTIVNS